MAEAGRMGRCPGQGMEWEMSHPEFLEQGRVEAGRQRSAETPGRGRLGAWSRGVCAEVAWEPRPAQRVPAWTGG